MTPIRELVHQAINTGYLDLKAESQLRELLCSKYDADDLRFFMKLQEAAMNGEVKLESHERQYQPRHNSESRELSYLFKYWRCTASLFNQSAT